MPDQPEPTTVPASAVQIGDRIAFVGDTGAMPGRITGIVVDRVLGDDTVSLTIQDPDKPKSVFNRIAAFRLSETVETTRPDSLATAQLIADMVVPYPAADAGAAAWARYHWARARGWSLTIDDLMTREDTGNRVLAQTTSLLVAEIRIAYLVDALDRAPQNDARYGDRITAALQRNLNQPEDLDELIRERLREHGIDPERIGRYRHALDGIDAPPIGRPSRFR